MVLTSSTAFNAPDQRNSTTLQHQPSMQTESPGNVTARIPDVSG
jgi:hypothetical protein